MQIDKISNHANRIYDILEEKKEINLSELKELSKLNDRDIYLALGWLSRDSKVLFLGNENDFNNGNIHLIQYKYSKDLIW
jgi:hypothetical protein